MKRGVKRAVLALVACALVVCVLPAFADSQARIVRLSYLDGSVEIDRNAGDGFERAIVNMPIPQGAKLWTHEDGEAEIEFEDGSTVRLAPDTRVSFDELSLRSDGGKVTLISVEGGTAYFNVRHKDEDDVRVVFSGNEVKLAKTAHFRAEVKDRAVSIAVFKGELDLQGTQGEQKIKKNETVSFNLDNPKYELAKGVTEGQYDWWDKERDDYQKQYAYQKNSTYASSAYGGPSYGWSDLNYYGSMFYVPGWGNVWRPYDVAYNWDPFSTGYWMYYPGWGYTWISPYPWGWTPYRYGNWLFAPGYGWVWQPTPGGYGNWNPRPRYTNPPSSYRPPAPPVPPTRYPTRPGPGRAVVAVGNPNDTDIPRWTPRSVPGRQSPIVTRGGVPIGADRQGDRQGTPAGANRQVDRKTPGTTAPVSGSHVRSVPMDRGGNIPVDRRAEPRRGADGPRSVETPRPAPAPAPHPAPAPTPHVAPSVQHSAPSYSPPMSAPSGGAPHSSGASSTRNPK